MLTMKKNQTVKAIKPIRIGKEIVEVGTILIINKGGKVPVFLTYRNNEPFAFSVGSSGAEQCFEDVVVESKVEKEISNISFKKFKAIQTMDGFAMSADVYVDGKKIAQIENGGYGGPTSVHAYSEKNEEALKSAFEALKKIRGEKFREYEGESEILESFMNYIMQNEDMFISFKEKTEIEKKEWQELIEKYAKDK